MGNEADVRFAYVTVTRCPDVSEPKSGTRAADLRSRGVDQRRGDPIELHRCPRELSAVKTVSPGIAGTSWAGPSPEPVMTTICPAKKQNREIAGAI